MNKINVLEVLDQILAKQQNYLKTNSIIVGGAGAEPLVVGEFFNIYLIFLVTFADGEGILCVLGKLVAGEALGR